MRPNEARQDTAICTGSKELAPVLSPRTALIADSVSERLGVPPIGGRLSQSQSDPGSTSWKNSSRRLGATEYERVVQGIHRIVGAIVPPETIVAVISKGDSQLVSLKKRSGWHFPQDQDGRYAGFHPPDSASAIDELERVRAKGADYFLIPSPSFWWLQYYESFKGYLDEKFRQTWSDELCVIYELSQRRKPVAHQARASVRSMFQRARLSISSKAVARPEDLRLAIDSQLPERLRVGEGNAFYIAGWCYHPHSRLKKLEMVCNGKAHQLRACGLPRPDVKAAHYPHQDKLGLSLQSGFWGFVSVDKVSQREERPLVLRATLADSTVCERVVAHLTLEPGHPTPIEIQAGNEAPHVAICMATYNPPLELFKRQIDSIRSQTFGNWICLITDDGSRPDVFEKANHLIQEDRRFRMHRSQTGLGFYRNFERCLALAPERAQFVALSDHDDYWHPDKLEKLVETFDAETSLVYSDMRIVTESGREIAPTYWTNRPNNFTNFSSLLMANTITGGASMFRRNLLPLILPFPERIGEAYHDHWIGSVALAVSKIKYIDRPLYDYVQHGSNVIGHYAPQKSMKFLSGNASLSRPRQTLEETFRFWQNVYFSDLLRLQLMGQILQLRCGDRLSAAKATELRRIGALGRSWSAMLWLVRRAIGTRGKTTETVNAERPLLGATLWRQGAGSPLRQRVWNLRTRHPVTNHGTPSVSATSHSSVEMIREKIAPLELEIASRAPRRLNLLIPTIDLKYFFGGYITKFNLARQLAQDGLAVRMVIVDHCDWQPAQWSAQLKKFKGLEHFFEHVEVVYAYDRTKALPVNPEDVFMATTWWTAHIAHAAMRKLGGSRFVYLVQEYEPFTFAMGSLAALASQSYEFPHYAVFSSDLLRIYFKENWLGVFAKSATGGLEDSIAFQNAITDVGPITRQDLAGRAGKRLLYYARPEPHAARNMFELGILALSEAVEAGYFEPGWEFYGIGSVGPAQKITLAKGCVLTILPREDQAAYRDILRAHDLGLALMHTPHPSLVPIEMASAGMVVVTSAYANKNQQALGMISSNLIAAHPTIEQIKNGLREATRRVHDYEARVAGSKVAWARNWVEAFNPAVKAGIRHFVEASHKRALVSPTVEPLELTPGCTRATA